MRTARSIPSFANLCTIIPLLAACRSTTPDSFDRTTLQPYSIQKGQVVEVTSSRIAALFSSNQTLAAGGLGSKEHEKAEIMVSKWLLDNGMTPKAPKGIGRDGAKDKDADFRIFLSLLWGQNWNDFDRDNPHGMSFTINRMSDGVLIDSCKFFDWELRGVEDIIERFKSLMMSHVKTGT